VAANSAAVANNAAAPSNAAVADSTAVAGSPKDAASQIIRSSSRSPRRASGEGISASLTPCHK
jgi:hypothetical protein